MSDSGDNADVEYSWAASNTLGTVYYTLNTNGAIILTTDPTSVMSYGETYRFIVTAKDQGSPSLSSSTTVDIVYTVNVIRAVECENVSSGICEQRMPRLGHSLSAIESLGTKEWVDREQMPEWDFAHIQYDANPHVLRMCDGTFSLIEAHTSIAVYFALEFQYFQPLESSCHHKHSSVCTVLWHFHILRAG